MRGPVGRLGRWARQAGSAVYNQAHRHGWSVGEPLCPPVSAILQTGGTGMRQGEDVQTAAEGDLHHHSSTHTASAAGGVDGGSLPSGRSAATRLPCLVPSFRSSERGDRSTRQRPRFNCSSEQYAASGGASTRDKQPHRFRGTPGQAEKGDRSASLRQGSRSRCCSRAQPERGERSTSSLL